MKMPTTFGSYVRAKRLERGLTMRSICEKMGFSLPYMSDIENDRRNPLEKDRLEQLMNLLSLSVTERQELYDLVGRARDTVSPDLTDYIMDVDAVRIALRTARDAGASPDEWLQFAKELQDRKRG